MEKKSPVDAGPISDKDRRRPGPWPPGIEPFVSKLEHNPRELKSWAKRTGFNPNFSGETNLSSGIDEGGEHAAPLVRPPPVPLPERDAGLDLEKGLGNRRRGKGAASKVEMELILGQRRAGAEIKPVTDPDPELVGLNDVGRRFQKEMRRIGVKPEVGLKEEDEGVGNDLKVRTRDEGVHGKGRGNGEPAAAMGPGDGEEKKDEVEIDLFLDPPTLQNTPPFKSGLMCDLMENPGFGLNQFRPIQSFVSWLRGHLEYCVKEKAKLLMAAQLSENQQSGCRYC